MEVIWRISPLTVNAVTDTLRIVLMYLWSISMEMLTRVAVKRTLRKGQTQFSYETVGSFKGLFFGWRKVQYLRRKGLLNGNVRRHFRMRALNRLLFVGLTLSLIALEILVKYGLEFGKIKVPNEEQSQTYPMIGLTGDTSMRHLLDMKEELLIEDLQCDTGNDSILICGLTRTLVTEQILQRSRERLVLVKAMFAASSSADLDFVDHVEFDYLAGGEGSGDGSQVEEGNECIVAEKEKLKNFAGGFEFVNSDCSVEEATLRRLVMDMRLTRVASEVVDTADAVLTKILEKFGLEPQVRFYTYVPFKDELQASSEVTITREGFEKQNPRNLKLGSLNVNSNVEYEAGEQETVRLTDLTRRASGKATDPDFAIEFAQLTRSAQVGSDCLAVEQDKIDDLPLGVLYDGQPCLEVTNSVAIAERCDSLPITDESNSNILSLQSATVVVLLHKQQTRCVKRIMEKFGDQLDSSEENMSRTAFAIGLRFDIVCLRSGDKLQCAYGLTQCDSETGRDCEEKSFLQYDMDTEEWFPANDGIVDVQSRVNIAAVEVSGHTEEEVAALFDEIEILFKKQYHGLIQIAGGFAVRRRMLGFDVSFTVFALLVAISTQITDHERTVKALVEMDVAILGSFYLYGGGAFILIVLFSYAAICFLEIWEAVGWRKAKLGKVNHPASNSEWLSIAAKPTDTEERVNYREIECRAKIADDLSHASPLKFDFLVSHKAEPLDPSRIPDRLEVSESELFVDAQPESG